MCTCHLQRLTLCCSACTASTDSVQASSICLARAVSLPCFCCKSLTSSCRRLTDASYSVATAAKSACDSARASTRLCTPRQNASSAATVSVEAVIWSNAQHHEQHGVVVPNDHASAGLTGPDINPSPASRSPSQSAIPAAS